jgi:hypothetical protein
MKTKIVERLMNETPEHIKQQVSEYADNLVSNKTQTAVDWLFNQMSNVAAGYVTEMNSGEILTHAKQMEKEQIINATYASIKTGEQYYNETYRDKK